MVLCGVEEGISLSGTEVLLFAQVKAPVVSKSHSAHLALIETSVRHAENEMFENAAV